MIENKSLKILEYNEILQTLSNFAVSEPTRQAIIKILPSTDFNVALKDQETTKEMYLVKHKYNLSPVATIDDVIYIIEKAVKGSTLKMSELLKIARLIRAARIAKKAILSTGDDIINLKNIVNLMLENKELYEEIDRCILGESEMKDDASFDLKQIRKKLLSLDVKLKSKINSYSKSSNVSKYLQDNIITVRNGRFVVPVKSEFRSFVPGLIHDRSDTGSTIFVEPFEVVELNNELAYLKAQEAEEVERILKYLSSQVSNDENNLISCQHNCVFIDMVSAKCDYSISIKGNFATLNKDGYVKLNEARHPLIDIQKVVPVDIEFGKEFLLLLISGPNTGGKTVCLKTAGLFCLMSASGLMIPCAEGSFASVFDNVFCDIGDEQSILNSLSTFSSHMLNIKNITEKITNNSLVLLDEIGGGTDPHEGSALAIGILKYFELIKCKGIITTHYSQLKEYAFTSVNIENGCMQFNEDTLKPTYKLIIGLPGVSNALKISKSLGINDFILNNSYKELDGDKVRFENVLLNAQKVKAESLDELEKTRLLKAEIELDKIEIEKNKEKLNREYDRIKNNAKLETKRLVNNSLAQAEEIIEEMKELLKQANEKSILDAKRLSKKLEDVQYSLEDEEYVEEFIPIEKENIVLNQTVIIKDLNTIGKIVSLPNKKGEVSVKTQNATLYIKINNLGKTNKKTKEKSQKKFGTQTVANTKQRKDSDLLETKEIRVLGLTVAEAIEIIEPYLININSDSYMLKIIHGKGTGRLSKGIHEFLRTCVSVKSYRYGGYYEGDRGVTFVEV